MKIDFKQPKYMVPILVYPFLCLFFYVYHSQAKPTEKVIEKKPGMQENVADVSKEVKDQSLTDKLDAYKDDYKQADGYSAIGSLEPDNKEEGKFSNGYTQSEKARLDSIEAATKAKFASGINTGGQHSAYIPNSSRKSNLKPEDQALANALAGLGKSNDQGPAKYNQPEVGKPVKESDPTEIFRKQMAILDSMAASKDPDARAEAERQKAMAKAESERAKYKNLSVTKAGEDNGVFNSVFAKKESGFIKAIIDENIVGYSGSRIRIRLLDDIKAGNYIIPRGAYIYALISGFTDQRVKLTINSILQNDKILPVDLDLYDIDGLEGLYVPSSAFREFTRSLGDESMQGFNMQSMQGSQAQTQQTFLMSSIDKVFTSTSTALANLIRKNKAKIKYNSYIYLIDKKELQEAQKNY